MKSGEDRRPGALAPDRIAGLLCLASGLALVFLVIPAQTEPVDTGWVKPDTVPTAMAWVIAAGGLWLLAAPGRSDAPPRRELLRAAAGFAGFAAVLVAMDRWGFVATGPAMALGLMLAMGERRPRWLVAGAVAMPFAIWAGVQVGLGRPLP